MLRSRTALLVLALALAADEAPSQTVTWGGGFPNSSFNAPTNWVGGSVPPGYTGGTDTIVFDDNSDSNMNLNVAGVSLFQLQVTDPGGYGNYAKIFGGNSLTLGSGGIALSSSGEAGSLDLNVPVVLGADQAWTGGYVSANNMVSGSGALALSGGNWVTYQFNSGSNTFSGGLTVSGSTTTLGLGATGTPIGTGALTMGDGTVLQPSISSTITLANGVTFGDGTNGNPVVVGANFNGFSQLTTALTLTGPVTLVVNGSSEGMDSEIDLTPSTTLTLTGNIAGIVPGVCLDFGTTGTGNLLAIVKSPSITNVSRLDLEDSAAVVFDGGYAQLSNLGYSIGTTPSTYLGLGATYVGQVANFIANYANAGGFQGTLGFDNTSGGTTTFADAVDLTGFTSGSFVGLGSATSAILTGTITPPGGAAGSAYYFGGGGGSLTVASTLGDSTNSRSLDLSPGGAPLTLVLSGSGVAAYTGGTSVDGAALIFDTVIPSGNLNAGSSPASFGYIGNTPNSGISDASPQSFVNMFDWDGPYYGVIGFDSFSGPRNITGMIDLSDLPQGRFFLGTATSATFSGAITPTDNVYQFAGVKGGQVTVEPTALTDTLASVVIGLANPIESFGSQSSVTMFGNNTYSGTTTLQSGYLYVSISNVGETPIGTNTLIVPDRAASNGWVATLAASGILPVTLTNNIKLPVNGLALNAGSSTTLTLNGTISSYSSSGSLGIFGPVVIGGNNTYSGGTFVNNASVTVNSDTGLGTGNLTANGSTLTFTSASPILNSVSLTGTTATFAGSPLLYNVQMAESTLNFASDTAPSIVGFSSDSPNSGNTIDIGSGATLTIGIEADPEYHGVIVGSGDLVVAGGSLDLTGSNTGYSGTTTIISTASVVASNNSALGTGAVVVNGILGTNTGVTLANPVTLVDGGTLAGYGTFSPPSETIAFQNGSRLVPGAVLFNSGGSNLPAIGTLSFGSGASLALGPGGEMAFSLMDANGAAGVGYSALDLAGSLDITATQATPFNIYLFSYAPGTNVPEMTQAANFDPAQAYSWTLLSAAGGITNFSANAFTVDLAYGSYPTFLNSTGVGTFYVSQAGNDLMLNFTPVPEPSTWALMASGLFALGAAVRRRIR